MPGWDNWKGLLTEAFQQAREEGLDEAEVRALESETSDTELGAVTAARLFERLAQVPREPQFPFEEPNGLEEIRTLRNGVVFEPEVTLSDDVLLEKLHGAWLGRCAGCALGKPVEGFMGGHQGLASWERQKVYLSAIAPQEWPLRDYFPAASPAEDQTGAVWQMASVRETISYMESDDDIRYTIIGQKVLLEHGAAFTSFDVAHAWMQNLTFKQVCTAETQAYRNLAWAYNFHGNPTPHDQVDWEWVATFQNPYKEWIGAQIRIDSYGYAAPGNPELAAEFAWRDARISHVKNGIYGAMFCAAMIAAAFATDDVFAVVEAGLSQIPQTSRLYAELRQTMEICARHQYDYANFEAIIGDIYALLGQYHPVHTNNNAALCLAAVLVSGGDFHKGITFAVMGGWDSDCNGATVGSIVGAMTGAHKAPGHWVDRLNDTLMSEVPGYHPIAISECARRSLQIARGIQ